METGIKVKLQPRSAHSRIVGFDADGTLRVRVTAPPVDGKANKALIELLAARLGIARGRVRIASGQTARTKLVQIQGLAAEEIREGIAKGNP